MTTPSARSSLWIVLALTVAAFLSRLRGIDWLLPITHLDGSIIVHQVEKLRGEVGGDVESDGRFRYYPLLLAYAASLLPASSASDAQAASPEEHLRRATATWRQVRATAAFLGLFLVPLTFLLARRFLDGPWPLLAAGFVATSLLLATFGTQARPHAPTGAAILLTLLLALRLRERGDRRGYLWVGLAAGAAVGGLHYGVFVGPPILLAWLWRRRAARGAWIIATGVIATAIVVACYPFHFVGERGFLRLGEQETGTTLNLSGQALHLGLFNGRGFRVIPQTLWSYDPLLLAAALAGAGVLVARRVRGGARLDVERRRDLAIVLAHALPYTLVIGLYQNTWERFVIQLLPYAAVLGAYGVARLAAALGLGTPRARALAVIGALVVPSASCWRLGTLRERESTYELAADWVRENLPARSRLALADYDDLPLLVSTPELKAARSARWASLWLRYQLRLPESERARHPRYPVQYPVGRPHELVARYASDPLGYLAEIGADHLLIAVDTPGELAHMDSLREAARASGELVLRISPARDGDPGPAQLPNLRIEVEEWSRPFLRRLWASERLGGTLEIYRVQG